jgi:hypothetical protein
MYCIVGYAPHEAYTTSIVCNHSHMTNFFQWMVPIRHGCTISSKNKPHTQTNKHIVVGLLNLVSVCLCIWVTSRGSSYQITRLTPSFTTPLQIQQRCLLAGFLHFILCYFLCVPFSVYKALLCVSVYGTYSLVYLYVSVRCIIFSWTCLSLLWLSMSMVHVSYIKYL